MVKRRTKSKHKRKRKRITDITYDIEEELHAFELEMLAEALTRSEKRKTDYIV